MKDPVVATKMTKFIELNTIGVSKDSQLRAAKVIKAVSDSCEEGNTKDGESFFKYSYEVMAQRWKQLREAVEGNGLFTLPKFSPAFCTFFNQETEPQPGKYNLLINFTRELISCTSTIVDFHVKDVILFF